MNETNAKIFALGDKALTVDFGGEISVALNERVLKLAAFLTENPFCGFREIVPAYSSLTIFYDVVEVRKTFPEFTSAFGAVESLVKQALNYSRSFQTKKGELIKIPICFAAEYAPDLDFSAASRNLTKKEFIELFLNRNYLVFMLGFLPGFSYLGEVDQKISMPRKKTPRSKVPKGSVGIAGRQTGIYPFASPGGWQIIGRTNVEMFTPEAEQPTLLQIGDQVKFYESDF